MANELEALVEKAKAGDEAALEGVVRGVQDRVYNLAMRMLGNPSDAQDAAQEILVKVVTHLSSFRGESAFTTWVHRVAANHLLSARQKRSRDEANMAFETLSGLIEQGVKLAEQEPPRDQADRVLEEEMAIQCTQGMLLCVDREHRLAFILGEILELSSDEGAAVLEISSDAFRQRLARARTKINSFMAGRCGLFDQSAKCRCKLQVSMALKLGVLDRDRLRFANHPAHPPAVAQPLRELAGLLDAAKIFRHHPDYRAPDSFVEKLRQVIEGGAVQ